MEYNSPEMIEKTLERTKKLVWPEIKKYLKDPQYPTLFQASDKYPKEVNLFWKINKNYPERKGKYLRPTLVLLVAEALGTSLKRAIPIAAAMQLSQEWVLIHDDIEDKSDERRGEPTLHKLYGEELAINAGDALHMMMWKMISDQGSKEITDEFYKILLRTALGQGVEQIWTNQKRKLNKDEYFFVADSKSGYYSIAGPMRLGAIIAGANKVQIEKITEFGFHLGRCFQLVDDLIDMEQDKKEGKSTLVNSKGYNYAKKLAEQEKNQARKIFDSKLGFLSQEPARSKLKELIDFILERKY